MSLPTCIVTTTVYLASGNPDLLARLRAKLSTLETDGGFVVPGEVEATADPVTGLITLPLWPNARGTAGSTYSFTLEATDRTERLTGVVPAQPTATLQSCVALPAAPALPTGAQAIADAQAAGVVANTAATTATTQAGIATTQAGIATTKAGEAAGSAGAAAGSAGVASAKAGSADASATAAAGSAGDASGAATAAAGSATAAAGSATAASGSATAAGTSAAQANTYAGQAQGYRDTAATYRQNAIDSAGNASVSAGAAAGSASAAAGAAGAAAGSATAAAGSAQQAAASADSASNIAAKFGNVDAAVASTAANASAASASAGAAATSATSAATAQAKAEAARDSVNTTGKVFADTATGISGTTNGQTFAVLDAGLQFWIVYKNSAGAALEVARTYTKVGVDAALPSFYETIDSSLQGVTVGLDASRRIMFTIPDPNINVLSGNVAANTAAVAAALTSSSFETTDPSTVGAVLLRDAGSRVLGKIIQNPADAGKTDPVAAELAATHGSQATLGARLDRGLTPYGDHLDPYANRWSLRETRMRLCRLKVADAAQLVVGVLGDSYVAGDYWTQAFAKRLQDTYGSAGSGWVGFSWFGTRAGTWTTGAQPTGLGGNVRVELVTTQIIGTWTSAYNDPTTNAPSIGTATSSTAGDYIRVSAPAGHDSAQLFYAGDGTGVIAVSWDGGATYGANIALNTVGPANVALPGIPAAAFNARIKVVSGNVTLAGVDLRSSAPGVRVHKLGGIGSTAANWAGVTAATWSAQLAALGSHIHILQLGTNDQGTSLTPASFNTNMQTILANIATAMPWSDRCVSMPPENQRTNNTFPMASYIKPVREFAVPNDIAFIDNQYFFGSPANNAVAYSNTNPARPWYGADGIHPSQTTGGRALCDAAYRLLTSF